MSFNLYKKFETDNDKESNGIWFNIDTDGDDEKAPGFLLGHYYRTNPKFKKVVLDSVRENRGKNGSNDRTKENIINFVKAVVFDWRNVSDRDGNPIPFSKDAAIKLLTELPLLYDKLLVFVTDEDNFLLHRREEEVKN